MSKLLVTGFEPFARKNSNITQQALEDLQDISDIHTEILPVQFGRAAVIARDLAGSGEFDQVMLLGERPSLGGSIGFERKAHNRSYAGLIPDNAGQRKLFDTVVPNGPKTLDATMNYDSLVAALESVPLRVRVQHKIGRFVCNDVFYQLLFAQKAGNIAPSVGIGFAHIGSRTPVRDAQAGVRQIVSTLQDGTLDL